MGEYYFAFKKSQEGVKTLIVYTAASVFSMTPTTSKVVKVITGNEAEQLYKVLTGKNEV